MKNRDKGMRGTIIISIIIFIIVIGFIVIAKEKFIKETDKWNSLKIENNQKNQEKKID